MTDRLECLSLFINSECWLNWRSISADSPSRAGVWGIWIGQRSRRFCRSLWAGQGQFQMCHSCIWANSYLDKYIIHYTASLFNTPTPTAVFFVFFSPPSSFFLRSPVTLLWVRICHTVGFVSACHTTRAICGALARCLQRDKRKVAYYVW